MAFTDPILSGTELVRSAITSDDFVPGLSGWAIHKNGAAEFANATVRETLTVGDDIILGGRSLSSAVDSLPKGCIAWIRGYPQVATTTEAQIMYTEMQVVTGRFYEVFLTNITPDQGNTKATEFKIRWVVGTGSYPDNGSDIIALTLRLSPFENGNARAMFNSGFTGIIRMRASIGSLDGQNVRSWAPGGGCILGAYDLGVAPSADPGVGIIGNAPPGKTLKEFTITANSAKAYRQNGTALGGTYGNDMVQGNVLSAGSHDRSWCSFSAGDSALLADLSGVAVADFVICEASLDFYYWTNGNGTAIVGYHNKTSLPAGNEQSGGIPNKLAVNYTGSGNKWFDLKAAGSGAGSFIDALRTNYMRGLMVGAGSDLSSGYNGIGTGSGSGAPNPPRLHIKYYK